MFRFAVRRLAKALPLLLAVSFVVFSLVELSPGDPAIELAGESPTPERIEFIRQELRLDDSFLERYGHWVANAVQGDFGNSFVLSLPVKDLLVDKGGVTLSLTALALLIAVIGSLVVGALAGSRPGGWLDRAVDGVCGVALAVPSFWLAILLVGLFAVNLQWLPALGYANLDEGVEEWLRHLILPACALAAVPGAELTLQLKNSLREVMKEDFVFAARARGLSRRSVVIRHALRSAAIPVVTVLGYRVAQMIGTAVAVEKVFSLPGLGALAVDSVLQHDVPVILGIVMLSTATVVVVNLLVDMSYGFLNPKVRVR